MTEEVLRLHIEAFFNATMHQDEYDAEDMGMLEQCIIEVEFCENMAGDDNPYYQDLVKGFWKWLVEKRKRKIQEVLDCE